MKKKSAPVPMTRNNDVILAPKFLHNAIVIDATNKNALELIKLLYDDKNYEDFVYAIDEAQGDSMVSKEVRYVVLRLIPDK